MIGAMTAVAVATLLYDFHEVEEMLEWYEFLSSARGITSDDDVRRLTEHYSTGYGRLLGKYLPKDKNAQIYDIGCGPGLTLNILRSLGYGNLMGTDLSLTSIEIALGLGLAVKQANSIDDLASYPDNSMDRIFGVDLIEHLEKKELVRLIRVASQKLRKPEGMLILRFPNGDSPLVGRHLFNDVTHLWTYTSTAITGLLTMNGFAEAVFLDETPSFIKSSRWWKVPVISAASAFLRFLIRAATLERVTIFAPSFWVVAKAAECNKVSETSSDNRVY